MNKKTFLKVLAGSSTLIFLAAAVFIAGMQFRHHATVCRHGAPAETPLRDKCTSIIAVRDITADGSMILAHNEDLYNYCAHHYFFTPRAVHQATDIVTTFYGAKVPQVPETYAYTGTTIFDISYSPGAITSGINEYQVAVVNNMSYRRDPEDVISQGRIIWTEFTKFALERAKTAAEAVAVIGSLASKYKLGADTGSMFGVVDTNEGWWVEVTQEGQWVAERMQRGTATVRANIFRIGEVDFSSANFKYSEDLVSYAISKGWYDPKDTFNFTEVYADPEKVNSQYNLRREDRVKKLLKDRVAAKTVDPRIMMSIFRDHYEGTPYDLTFGHIQGSPHNTDERTLCRIDTEVSVVMQSRDWLPAEIGALCWRAMATPCSSIYTPWYLGSRAVPPEYRTGDSQFTRKSAYWAARNLSRQADMRYRDAVVNEMKRVQDEFESREFISQAEIEQKALDLYSANPEGARAYISNYTSILARMATAKINCLTGFAERN